MNKISQTEINTTNQLLKLNRLKVAFQAGPCSFEEAFLEARDKKDL